MLAFHNSRGLAAGPSRGRGSASGLGARVVMTMRQLRTARAAPRADGGAQGQQDGGPPTAAPAQSQAQQAPQGRLAGALGAGAVLLQQLVMPFLVVIVVIGLVTVVAQPVQALSVFLASKLEKPSWLEAVGVVGAAVTAVYGLIKAYVAGVKANLKADVAGVKADVAGVKADVKADVAGVKADLKADVAGVKADLKADVAGLSSKLDELLAAAKDQRFDRLERQVDAATASVLAPQGGGAAAARGGGV